MASRPRQFGAGEHVGNQFAIVEQQVAQFAAATALVVLVALERRQNRAESTSGVIKSRHSPVRSFFFCTARRARLTRDGMFPDTGGQERAQSSPLQPCLPQKHAESARPPGEPLPINSQPTSRPSRAEGRPAARAEPGALSRPGIWENRHQPSFLLGDQAIQSQILGSSF